MQSTLLVRFVALPLILLLGSEPGASQSTVPPVEDRQKCLQEFLDWCEESQSGSNETGLTILAVSYYDDDHNARIFCSVDSDGTECLKNKSPWFHCYPNQTLDYKGQPLDSDSEVDDEICQTKDSAVNFENQVHFNRTLFEQRFKEEMEHFYREMANLRLQMWGLRNRIFGGNFPFDDDFERGTFERESS